MLVAAVLLGAGIAALVSGLGRDAVRELTLPLHHDDIIRQQAHDKNLDPALIAAIIYEESRFRDQTSHAGARGLMQITPQTADAIAKHSGGIRFKQSDLADPQINISYGAYYLRLLLDHYAGWPRPADRPNSRPPSTFHFPRLGRMLRTCSSGATTTATITPKT
jgi:soluble lytic murein transglycosylase